MSAGSFALSGYTADDGKVYPVRHQPESAQATLAGGDNTAAPASAIQSGLPSAIIGKGRRNSGLHVRGVRVRFTGALPNDTYKPGGTTFIPVFSKSVYDAIPARGGTGTYLSVPVAIIGKVPEKIT